MNREHTTKAPEINPRQFVGYFFQPDALLGWSMVPGRQGWFIKPPIRTWIHINRWGMRGADVPVQKPASLIRILLLSDSFGVAIEVEEKDTFARVLERQLNQPGPGTQTGYQVINASVGGYGTEQQYLYLREHGSSFQPDIVLLAFHFGDDLIENSVQLRELVHWRLVKLPRPYLESDADGRLTLVGHLPDALTTRQAWQRYWDLLPIDLLPHVDPTMRSTTKLRLDRMLRRSAEALRNNWRRYRQRNSIPYDLRIFDRKPAPLFEEAWAHTENLLYGLKLEAEKLGALFLVAGLCTKEQAQPKYLAGRLTQFPEEAKRIESTYPNSRLEEILSRHAIPYLDLTPPFSTAQARGEHLFFPHDLHWNEAGHRMAGLEIARFVQNQ